MTYRQVYDRHKGGWFAKMIGYTYGLACCANIKKPGDITGYVN